MQSESEQVDKACSLAKERMVLPPTSWDEKGFLILAYGLKQYRNSFIHSGEQS